MTCVECRKNRYDQMKELYYENEENCRESYQDGYNQALEDIENKAQEFKFKHIEEYGVEIVEGNSEAFDDLLVWLAEKR